MKNPFEEGSKEYDSVLKHIEETTKDLEHIVYYFPKNWDRAKPEHAIEYFLVPDRQKALKKMYTYFETAKAAFNAEFVSPVGDDELAMSIHNDPVSVFYKKEDFIEYIAKECADLQAWIDRISSLVNE